MYMHECLQEVSSIQWTQQRGNYALDIVNLQGAYAYCVATRTACYRNKRVLQHFLVFLFQSNCLMDLNLAILQSILTETQMSHLWCQKGHAAKIASVLQKK